MSFQTFNDFDEEGIVYFNNTTFQFREDKTEKGTLIWLNNNFTALYETSLDRYIVYRRHLALYKNLREEEFDGFTRAVNRDLPQQNKKPKVKMNYAYEMIEQKVADDSRKKINVALIPRNFSDESDINNVRSCKMFLRARAEEMDLDKEHRDADRVKYLFGHVFMEVCWDKDQGPVHPAWEAAKKAEIKEIPVYDDATGETLEKVKFDPKTPVRIGDVKVKTWMPYRVFPEMNKPIWRDVDHVETYEWMDKEKVYAEWPGKKKKIESGINQRICYDFSNFQTYVPENKIMVRTFWHRPTKYFPEGAKIIYCDECILEWGDFPYNDAELPFVPDTDVDVPDEQWGRSQLINTEQLIRMNNNVLSGVARNHGVASMPKWVYPDGSVQVKDLHNSFGNIQFKGAIAPQLVRYDYMGKADIDLQNFLESRIGKQWGIYKVSQGDVPPGVVAAAAIRYLDEQQTQRNSTATSKRNRRVVDVYKKMIARMAQYYTETDGRTINILGKNNQYMVKSFKKLDFNQIYGVEIEKVPWISDTMGGRIADIIDLNAANQQDPLFGKEEMSHLLDLGLDDQFKTEVAYGVDTARTILEMLQDGEEVVDPEESDNLLVFLDVFYRFIESIEFKFKLGEDTRSKIIDYIMAVEMLCWDKSQINGKFAADLAMKAKFPVYFETPPTPMSAPPADAPTAPSPETGLDASKMEITQQALQNQLTQGEDSNAQ